MPDDRPHLTSPEAKLGKGESFFSDETIQSFRELGAVLTAVHKRLAGEGYVFKNGILQKKHNLLNNTCNSEEKSKS